MIQGNSSRSESVSRQKTDGLKTGKLLNNNRGSVQKDAAFVLCGEDEVGVLVDEGDDFVVVLGFLVVGAVALEDVAVGEG